MKNVCFNMTRKAVFALAAMLVFTLPAFAQHITIHGSVSDETGETLIGATIMEKGTSNGTATDYDGNYQLSVNPNATLIVSYLGYNPKEVAVGGRTTVNVVMSQNSTMLQETVVIGYGTVKKSDATGSVDMVTPSEVEAGISTSVQDLLVGASPGVVVTPSGGSPEGGAAIRIRGGASLNASNDPLIVLDGVPLSGVPGANPLSMIAPDNIESMTILKDASATAIYGSRASNGVIIITTKKGQSGRPQVNFSATMSVNSARKEWKVLDGNQFAELITSGRAGIPTGAAAALGYDANGNVINTNWQNQIYRTTVSQDYNLSVGGTAGFLPYRVSASYTNNKGILKKSDMERVTVGFNLTPRFFGGLLQVNANVKGYYIRNNYVDEGCTGGAIDANPTRPVYTWTPSGNEFFPYFYNGFSTDVSTNNQFNTQGTLNPLAQIMDVDNKMDSYRSNGNLQIDYALHFLPELHLNLNLGYDVTKTETNKYIKQNSPTAWKDLKKNGAGYYNFSHQLNRNTLLDFYANYKKEFEAIYSNLDVMAGYSWQRFHAHGRNNSNEFTTIGFMAPSTTEGVLTFDPESKPLIGTTYAPYNYWDNGNLQLISFFGRLNYSFKDTYLLTFTLRDDGTSRFSKENRWGLFPSLALGWKIINMPFMEKARDTMNEFKLRLGWGITGQQDVGGYFDYMASYAIAQQGSYYPNLYTGQYVDENGNPVSYTYYPAGYNPNLKWEETTTWNVGVDMGFLNNRVTVALDWYLRDSKDLLSNVTVAPGSATTNMMVQNIGTLRNMGVEGTIGAKIFDTQDFTWNSSINVAWNKNEITKLNATDDPNSFITTGGMGATGNTCQIHKIGYPAYSFYLYEQIYDQNGLPIEGAYVDQNGDGYINDSDLVIKHSRDPKVTMAWNNTFNYKNWDFSFQVRANIGNYVYNNILAKRSYLAGVYSNQVLRNLVENDNVYFQSAQYYSDYYLENAGFVRIDNITAGYTWDNLFNNNLRIRLYAAVQNPFVITKYKGLDPEVFGGIDNSVYPRPVTYTLGLVATF